MVPTLAPIVAFQPGHLTTTATVTCSQVPAPTTVDIAWYRDNKLVEMQWNVPVEEGTKLSKNFTLAYDENTAETTSIVAKIYCGTHSFYRSNVVNNHLELSPLNQVETMEVLATVKKGDIVVYDDFSSSTTYHVVLPNGQKGFMSRSALTISQEDFVQYEDYSTAQKEYFIKKQKYTSPTDLLVWISLKTQKVNVFSGGNGNWKLLHTFPCCSGKNVSLGCIRMLDNDVGWLWDNMKVGTTVVVY